MRNTPMPQGQKMRRRLAAGFPILRPNRIFMAMTCRSEDQNWKLRFDYLSQRDTPAFRATS
jgi:hypothetical protein